MHCQHIDIDKQDREFRPLFMLSNVCRYRFDIVDIDNRDRGLGIWNACRYRFDINIQDRGFRSCGHNNIRTKSPVLTSIRYHRYRRYRQNIVSWTNIIYMFKTKQYVNIDDIDNVDTISNRYRQTNTPWQNTLSISTISVQYWINIDE